MTDREELIGQAVRVIHDGTCGGGCDTWADFVHPAKSLVDAGWRPPVSGDVIERVARTVQAAVADREFALAKEFYEAGHGGDYPPTRHNWDRLADFEQDAWRDGARHLVDAGLLADRPTPLDRAAHEYHGTYPRLEDVTGPHPLEMVDAHVSVDGSSEGIVGDLATSDAREFVSIPVPPDAETVERVISSLHDVLITIGVDPNEALMNGRTTTVEVLAQTALRALTEVSTDAE